MYDKPAFVYLFSGYPLRSSEGHAKKTFHHRDTEDTETFKKQSGVLCASSERNERVVELLILTIASGVRAGRIFCVRPLNPPL